MSKPQDGISLNSYPGAGNRVRRRIESAATRIQPPELELVADRISRNSHSAAFQEWI